MAYRLKPDEPVGKGFKRIGMEQIARAERELEAAAPIPAAAIHEARKCLKRMRALLRLFRPGLGEARFKSENQRYREIGALLAPARDNHVLIETALKLENEPRQTAGTGIVALRKLLQEEAGAAATSEEFVGRALEKLSIVAKGLRRHKTGKWTFDVVEQGLKRAYRRSQETFTAAYASPSDEALHEWRKTVQQHWRHMQLLSQGWPDYFAARINAAKALSRILGDDHDLALLRAYVAALPAGRLSPAQIREIEGAIEARQEELRREAAPRGRILLAERAKGLSRRVAIMWGAAVDVKAVFGEERRASDDRHADAAAES